MRRVASTLALLVLSGSALAFAGCSSDDRWDDHGYDYSNDNRCSGYSTCGSCTPVLGCGWCTYPDGTGACRTGADRCGGDTFRWNWEPEGCATTVVDSGTASDTSADAPKSDGATDATDAGSDAPASDGPNEATSDAGETSSDTPTPVCDLPTSGLNGCVSTTGGTLCGAGQYTVACHPSGGSTPSPDASLKCAVELADPSGSYYCCPCASSGT